MKGAVFHLTRSADMIRFLKRTVHCERRPFVEISTVFFICYVVGLSLVTRKRAQLRGCVVSSAHRAKQIKIWLLLSLLLACGMFAVMRGDFIAFILLYGLSLITTSFAVTVGIRLLWKWQDQK